MSARLASRGAPTVPTLKPETEEARRRAIEEVALERFVAKGHAATTTREIARGVGLTPGALYAHYPSKEALFAAVVERYRERLHAPEVANPVRDALEETDFPHDLPRLARAVRDLVRVHRTYWKLWYVDVVEFEGKHFRSALAPTALLEHPRLRERLEALREAGALGVDPGVAFTMIYMHLFNYFLIETLFGGDDHYGLAEDDAIAAMTQVFRRGVVGAPVTEEES